MARARASLEREDRPALLPVSRSEDFTINKSLLNAAISVRNEAGDVHITLGDVADLGSETPNGMFARLRVSAPGPFVVSIAPAVEGQMRTNPGIAGWDVNGDGPVYLGFSTALADEAVFEIFRWSENFWNVVGPCRAAAGDENGISSVTGAGHIIQEDGADLTAQPNLNFGSGLTASNDSENEATLVEIAPGVGLGDMLSATYDPTGVEDDAFAMDSMIEGSDAKIMTAAERSSIASALQPGSFDLSDLGNVSDDTADAGNLLVGGGATFASKAITGAVTINSSGSTSLTDDSATNAKLANMAQATFKGRADGAGTGDPVDLTATQALTIIKTVDGTGSGLDADTVDTIEGASILQKTQLAASTITPGTGTLDLTGTNGQVLKVDGSGNVAFDDEGSVPTELGDLSDVGDGTPTSGYILAADGDSWESVPVSGDLTLVASGAATIANNSVTNAKAQDMAQSTIKGRASGAGTGDPTDLTATQARTILNVEDGADVTDATNVAAAGALMAATYDPNTVADDAFDMDNMVEGSDTKILTAAERTLIAGALQDGDIGESVLPIQPTTIELGDASDTTLSRSGAGALAVEGVNVLLAAAENVSAAYISSGVADAGQILTADGAGAATFEDPTSGNPVAVVLGGSSDDYTSTPFQVGSDGLKKGESLVINTTVVGTHVYEFTHANLEASSWGAFKKNTTTASVVIVAKGDNTGGSEVTLRYGTSDIATDTNLELHGDGSWEYDSTNRVVHLYGDWAGAVDFHDENLTSIGTVECGAITATGDSSLAGDFTMTSGSISGNSLDPDDGTGALAATSSGKRITTTGSITIPNSAIGDGFWQGLIEVGADTHDWTFNSLTMDVSAESFSAGEVYSVVVKSTSVIDIDGPQGPKTESDFS